MTAPLYSGYDVVVRNADPANPVVVVVYRSKAINVNWPVNATVTQPGNDVWPFAPSTLFRATNAGGRLFFSPTATAANFLRTDIPADHFSRQPHYGLYVTVQRTTSGVGLVYAVDADAYLSVTWTDRSQCYLPSTSLRLDATGVPVTGASGWLYVTDSQLTNQGVTAPAFAPKWPDGLGAGQDKQLFTQSNLTIVSPHVSAVIDFDYPVGNQIKHFHTNTVQLSRTSRFGKDFIVLQDGQYTKVDFDSVGQGTAWLLTAYLDSLVANDLARAP